MVAHGAYSSCNDSLSLKVSGKDDHGSIENRCSCIYPLFRLRASYPWSPHPLSGIGLLMAFWGYALLWWGAEILQKNKPPKLGSLLFPIGGVSG